MPPAIFALVTFEISFLLCFQAKQNCDLPFYVSLLVGMTGACHHAQLFLIEVWSSEFLPG
jgi:hypothetical protein